jgi:hypothetical protein
MVYNTPIKRELEHPNPQTFKKQYLFPKYPKKLQIFQETLNIPRSSKKQYLFPKYSKNPNYSI